jgi:hypothetical protein
MKKKLTQQQQQTEEQQQMGAEQRSRQQMTHEFQDVEAMLRHDALHTPLPPAIARRLQESIGQWPLRPQPWWRRWLGS